MHRPLFLQKQISMEIIQALNTIEYKIATESDSFEAGRPLHLDINAAWPAEADLADALRRKYPWVSVSYERQQNDCIRLQIVNRPPQ